MSLRSTKGLLEYFVAHLFLFAWLSIIQSLPVLLLILSWVQGEYWPGTLQLLAKLLLGLLSIYAVYRLLRPTKSSRLIVGSAYVLMLVRELFFRLPNDQLYAFSPSFLQVVASALGILAFFFHPKIRYFYDEEQALEFNIKRVALKVGVLLFPVLLWMLS